MKIVQALATLAVPPFSVSREVTSDDKKDFPHTTIVVPIRFVRLLSRIRLIDVVTTHRIPSFLHNILVSRRLPAFSLHASCFMLHVHPRIQIQT